MDRLVGADSEATVTQITSLYSCGEQKSISESTICQTLRRMGYNSRRLWQIPLLSAKNRNMRLQCAQAHQNWTVEDWEKCSLI